MVKLVFSIQDIKGVLYADPFMAMSHAEALRTLQGLAQNPQTTIHQWPEDYVLYQVGTFNTQTGELGTMDAPFSLGSAAQFVQPQLMEEAN